jgi:hypothetical protein
VLTLTYLTCLASDAFRQSGASEWVRKSTMNPQLVTPIVSGISVIAGGLVALLGVALTNRGNTQRLRQQLDHDATQEKARIRRERGEELYQHTDKWTLSISTRFLD